MSITDQHQDCVLAVMKYLEDVQPEGWASFTPTEACDMRDIVAKHFPVEAASTATQPKKRGRPVGSKNSFTSKTKKNMAAATVIQKYVRGCKVNHNTWGHNE